MIMVNTDIALKILFNLAKEQFVTYFKNKKLFSVFLSVGSTIANLYALEAINNNDEDQLVQILFSEENMNILAEECKGKSGYDFKRIIKEHITGFLGTGDVKDSKIEKVIDEYLLEFETQLKSEHHDLYQQFFLQDLREENHKLHEETHLKLDKIIAGQNVAESNVYQLQATLEGMEGKHDKALDVKQYAVTLVEAEKKLRYHTAPYHIDLDFFDYGQADVEDAIVVALRTRQAFWVKFHSKAEGKYYLLRIIKNILPEMADRVLIVEKESDWYSLGRCCVQDKILIPMFAASQLEPLHGNQTIYILTGESFDYGQSMIVVPNRTRNNLFVKLNNYVKDHDKTHELIEQTSGVFAALMRKVSDFYVAKPEWTQAEKVNLVAAALVGAWTDKEGDKGVVSQLAGVSYEDYKDALRPYLNKEDPFLITCSNSDGREFRVANTYEAFYQLKEKISKRELGIFSECVKKVLAEQDSKLHELGFREDCGNYSRALKTGIIKTLIVMSMSEYAYGLGYEEKFLLFARTTIKDILRNLKTSETWEAIAEFLPLLMEAAPEEVIERLEQAVENDAGAFWSLFENTNTIYFTNDLYVGVLEALTVALFIDEVSISALRVLEKLAAKNIEYKLGNSPIATLCDYFNCWYCEVNVTSDNKIAQLEHFAKSLPDACWKVLTRVAPTTLSFSPDKLRKPLYRPYTVAEVSYINDAAARNEIGKAYFRIAFVCAGTDLKKWAFFFKNTNFLLYGLEDELLQTIQSLLQKPIYSDEEKYGLEKALRSFLYTTRYYKNESRYGKGKLDKLETELLQAIHYENPTYGVLYAFDEMNLDTRPIPCDDDRAEKYFANIQKKEALQKEIIAKLADEGIGGLQDLILMTSDSRRLGENICEAYSKNIVSVDFAHFLYENKRIATLHGYLGHALASVGKECFVKTYNQMADEYEEPEFRFQFLETQRINDGFITWIESLDEETRAFYWTNTGNTWYDIQHFTELRDLYLKRLVEYGNLSKFILLLEDIRFRLDTYVQVLVKIVQNRLAGHLQSYVILKFFERIYDFEIRDVSLKETVVQLEMFFIRYFYDASFYDGLQPKFLLEKLRSVPEFSADLITNGYDGQQEETDSDTDEGIKKRNWSLLCRDVLEYAKFCPCTDREVIDENRLSEWCDAFINRIIKNKAQKARGKHWLGKFLANCPPSERENVWPLTPVCDIIDKFYDADLAEGFIIGTLNNRGCFTQTHGRAETKLAERYESYSQQLELQYGKTAKILRRIAKYYRGEAAYFKSSAMVYE